MELKPGIGVGLIRFGLNPGEVEELLGHPDRVGLDEEEEGSLSYQYNHLKLRLGFYHRTDGKLAYLRCAHPALRYQKKMVIGAPVARLQRTMKKNRQRWMHETYDFYEAYFDEENWLTLNVEYEVVVSVELGLRFDELGNYIWP